MCPLYLFKDNNMKRRDSLKRIYPVKIENRGKCSEEELIFTEEMLDFICNKLNKGAFMKIDPKMFYVLKKSEIEENELGGFEFTICSSFFKGRIEIRETVDGNYNIYYYKRANTKGKFQYELYNKDLDVPEDKLLSKFDFLNIENEELDNIFLKKGDVVILDTGYVGIIRKYYSNQRIGIVFDEDSEEVEEYIPKTRIVKKMR